MELDLRLGNDPPFGLSQKPPPPSPPPPSHPTPLDFSLALSSILQPSHGHQTHNQKPNQLHQSDVVPHSFNPSPLLLHLTPLATASRRSSQSEDSEGGAGVFTDVISGATAAEEGGGRGELGRSKAIVCSSYNNKNNSEERGGKSENEEDEEMRNLGGRKKLRLSRQQSAFLEESFKQHHTLYPKQKLEVARKLNLRPRQVEVWFQNRRARTKLKQTEVECEYLKNCCETLTQQNIKLQKELQDLRALKTTQSAFMNFPATTLTLCASCERAAATAAATPNSNLPFHLHHLTN